MSDLAHPPTELMGSRLRTFQAIFREPIATTLNWDEVQALFRNLGRVESDRSGNLIFTRNGTELLITKPTTKEISKAEDVVALRDFIRKTEAKAM